MQNSKKQQANSGHIKPVLPPHTRRLKIQPKYISRPRASFSVPVIMLTGEWLRKLGFECESHVLIEENDGCLIIRVAPSLPQ